MIHRGLFALAIVLGVSGGLRDGFERWIDTTDVPPLGSEVSTQVLDRNGELLRAYPVETGIWRLATTPKDVDPSFLQMLMTAEDKRFADHSGVDITAMLRAGFQALKYRRIVSGGSTLTMQVARLLENSGTGGWPGKLRQIRLALALERRLSKDQILSLYLTHAPYGGNIEGVRAASRAWFGKPPARLTPEESALLVALPQSPTARRPDRYPAAAKRARDRLLRRQGFAPSSRPVPSALHPFPMHAPHLADRAIRATPDVQVLRTTIDLATQRSLNDLARRAVWDLPDRSSAAILVADHTTGEILAYVGSAEFARFERAGFVDMVQAIRSPGSTLKPLIYALAFDQGLAHPETVMPDHPVEFDGYSPQNFDGHFRGDVTARAALEQSLNIPPLLLTDALGVPRLMAAMRKSGMNPKLPSGQAGLAVALGGVGVTLQELVGLFGGLARGGQSLDLTWNTPASAPANQFVSRSAAWQVGHILAGVAPPNGQSRGRIAYKTGTSYGHRDAWAIGWDGRHVIGIWLGRPDGTPVPGIFGGERAAPILFEAFGRVKATLDPLPPPPPETLIAPTSLLPKPLQNFQGKARDALSSGHRPQIVFPPEGAILRKLHSSELTLKFKGGQAPFVLLVDDRPVVTGNRKGAMVLSDIPAGFTRLEIIDAAGLSDTVSVEVR